MSESASMVRAKPVAVPAIGKVSDTQIYSVLFAAAVAAFCLARLIGDRFGPTSHFVAIAGDATCGWSWLVVRALFRKPADRREIWPLALVLALVAAGALLRFHGYAGPVRRMVVNVETLVSSTLLLLAAIEPLTGLYKGMPATERRFRLIFAAGYVAMLAVAVLWIDGSPPGSITDRWSDPIKMICAMLALLGMGLAIRYRHRNPLPDAKKAKPRLQIADETGLGERLLCLISDEAIYTLPELRVAELARQAGEAEYKVTSCITGTLGFRNFNHMANHFRIEAAKAKLGDARLDRLPILTIALDCGFGSIGPFNRAFKEAASMTPKHFRESRRIAGRTLGS